MDKPSGVLPPAFDQFRIPESSRETKSESLGQQQFFDLMITQLQNQDPFKPMESGEFLGQIAQFGTVNGITELQQSFATLAGSLQSNQALQASTMVGRDVVIPRDEFTLNAGQTSAPVYATLPASSPAVRVSILDGAGQVVRENTFGPVAPGAFRVDWDGLDNQAKPVAPGTYSVRIDATIGSETVALDTAIQARVDSVSLSRDGSPPRLNVDGIGPVDISEVLEIL